MTQHGTPPMERLLPQNIEAEMGVLGSIIIDPEALLQVLDFLRADDFYRDAHRTIYEAMLDLFNQRIPADFITICDELERRNKLEEVGGASYITSLVNQVPTSGNAEHYGRIVERTATLRRLIWAAGQIAAIAYDDTVEDATEVVDQAERWIFEIGARANALGTDAPIAQLIMDYMEHLNQLHERRGTIVGVPTGFTDLDRLTGGLQRSDLIILAARPSIGKTALALSLAHNTAVRYGRPIGIFSLEMGQEQLVQRLVAIQTGIDTHRLRTGWIEDDEWEAVVRACQTLSEAPIRIDSPSVLSPAQMRSRARRWVAEYGIELIIVDYLQLMHTEIGGRRNENRVQEVSEISRNLKLLARELNIPILVLAQLSREVERRQSKIPQLSDLRESGSIEQDSDIVMFIYRDEVYNPNSERRNVADIIVAKHRNGSTGEICLHFEPRTTLFRDLVVSETVPPLSEATAEPQEADPSVDHSDEDD